MRKKPNVLIYMTDQQRATTAYPYGKAHMPNLEKFAKQSTVFAQTHTVSPHCCPARASLFSGLYPSQHGVWNNVDVGTCLRKGLYDGITLFSEDFKRAGYRTYYSGKWHISHVEGPCDRGFDINTHPDMEYSGVLDNNRPPVNQWNIYKKYKEDNERGEGQVLRKGYLTYTQYATKNEPKKDDRIAADGIEILRNRSKIDKEYDIKCEEDAPWFQVISTNDPHDPYFVSQKYLDLYDIDDIELPDNFYDDMEDKPALYRKTAQRFKQLSVREQKEAIRHYLAACSHQDDLFGQVMAALEESGEADNTIVIYLSDHGDYMGDHGIWCKGLPCFEGAYHIPLIVRMPKSMEQQPRIVDDFTNIVDVAPTLLDLCDIDYDHPMTGISLKPYIEGKTPENKHEYCFTQSNGNEIYGIQRSVRNKKWKYTYNGFDFDEFYDLESDPGEMHNLFEQYKDSEELKEMSKQMWKFAKQVGDVCVNPYILTGLATYGPGIIFEDKDE